MSNRTFEPQALVSAAATPAVARTLAASLRAAVGGRAQQRNGGGR